MQVSKTMQIRLKSGDILSLEMSDVLVSQIMKAFMLERAEDVTERHVKYYLTSSFKKALEETDEGRLD
jgi:hypothetical protein